MEDTHKNLAIPETFQKIIMDLTDDLTTTFPEYAFLWSKWTSKELACLSKAELDVEMKYVFEYCTTVYPERFFDILYKNDSIFNSSSVQNTMFLPCVEFKALFNCDNISDATRTTIWNYLQLVLFTVVGEIQDKNFFGNSANMFDGINESDLHNKLVETFDGMSNFFTNMASKLDAGDEDGLGGDGSETKDFDVEDESDESDNGEPAASSSSRPQQKSAGDGSGGSENSRFEKMGGMPNPAELLGHLKGLFNGKIGTLAKELAEEISGEFVNMLGDDAEGINSTQDVFKKLMGNQGKITELIKTVNAKLNEKINLGEISRDELMKEASDLMGKMSSMGGSGGLGNFKDIFKNMSKMSGMSGMEEMFGKMNIPKNAKVDLNAMNQMSQSKSSREKMKDRILKKKAAAAEAAIREMKAREEAAKNYVPYDFTLEETANPKNLVFRIPNEESQETSAISAPASKSSKKKKSKKKK
jgi:hypothetical protein